MKVLVFSGAFPPFPAPESPYTALLCEELARRATQVHLVTRTGTGEKEDAGFVVDRIMPAWDWRRLPTLARIMRNVRPDVVLLIYIDWIYNHHPMVTFLPTLSKWVLPGIPCVTLFLNESGLAGSEPVRSWRHRLVKGAVSMLVGRRDVHATYGTLLRDCDGIVALSERHLDAFERAHSGMREKATVTPAPPVMRIRLGDRKTLRNEGRAALALATNDETQLLAYLGYIYPGKGVETLLRSVAILKSRPDAPRFKLLLLGTITDPTLASELARIEQQSCITDSLIWLGHKDDEEASTLLHAADIAILPFDVGIRLNNSSFTVCAMHRLPVVTTRGPDLEDSFRNEENVLLCPEKNAEALADAIQRLASSAALREKLGTGAYAFARSTCSWDRTGDAILQLFRRAKGQD